MNYVILKSEVKAFTRTRRGKLEHVRGYTSSRSKKAVGKKEAPKRVREAEAEVRPLAMDAKYEYKKEEKKTSFREPIGREKKIIGHTPTGIERIARIINKLLDKVKRWKKAGGGSLTNTQKKIIKQNLKKIEPKIKSASQKVSEKRRRAVREALANLREELEVKSKMAEKRQTTPLKKKHPGVPLKGLTKNVYEGLISRGYSRAKILKMGVDAAKAVYWNDIKP